MNQLYTFLSIFCLNLATLCAQTTTGTEFWLGYMENLTLAFNDAPQFAIIVNAETPTNGAIEVPTTGLSLPFSVGVGSTEIFLPQAIFYTETSEVIDNKGIRIVTDLPVRVQAYHYRIFFTESTNLLPVTELGTDYLVTTMIDDQGSDPSSLVIVATADNTEIEITPTTITLGLRPPNIPFTVTLNAGQNYQVQASGELAGTRVRSLSGQAIAVFAGAQQANISTDDCVQGTADSHVWDQSLPLEDWRDLYYFVPFAGQGGDRLRIMAAADETQVFFDCDEVATLQSGEFFETQREPATVISATGAISVSQYSNGFSCEPQELGDPNGLSYLPADFLGTNFRWYASDRGGDMGNPQFSVHWVTIVGPEESFVGLTVDGTPVAQSEAFGADPTWRYAQLELGPGEHQVLALAGLQAYSYGLGFADAYTQNMGYETVEPQSFACLEIDREGILCVDSLQQFTFISNLNLTSFAWDFGDDSGSLLAFPTHAYDEPGTYEVSLLASTADDTMVSATITFVVVDCGDAPCDPNSVDLNIRREGDFCVNFSQDFSFTASFVPTAISWDFGDNSPLVNTAEPTHFYTAPGFYTITLTLTDELGCTYTEESTVPIIACDPCGTITTIIPVISIPLCAGVPVTFDADYQLIGVPLLEASWKFSNGDVINEEVAEVVFDIPGTYTASYFAVNAEGCIYTASVEVDILECDTDCDDLPSLSISGPISTCVLTAQEFFAVTTAILLEYEWSVNGEIRSTDNTFFYSFAFTGGALISLRAIDVNGCEYFENFKISVNDCQVPCDLEITDVIIDGVLCVDSLFHIEIEAAADNSPVFTIWTISQNELFFSSSLDDLQFVSPGTYSFEFITFSEPGCFIDSVIVVDIVDCTNVCDDFELTGLTTEGDLCVGEVLTFTPTIDQPFVSAEWFIDGGFPIDLFVLTDVSFGSPGERELQLVVTNAQGCTADTTFTIVIEEDCPVIPDCSGFVLDEILLSDVNCVDSLINITPVFDQDFTTATWTFPDGSIVNELVLSDIAFAQMGPVALQLQLVNAEACEIDTTLQLTIETCVPTLDCELMLPNIFSPNNDGLNDSFRAFFAPSCEPVTFELQIFDRWGGMVYETTDPLEGWNGEFRSKAHPAGILVYWCRYSFTNGQSVMRSGDVTLIR